MNYNLYPPVASDDFQAYQGSVLKITKLGEKIPGIQKRIREKAVSRLNANSCGTVNSIN